MPAALFYWHTYWYTEFAIDSEISLVGGFLDENLRSACICGKY